MKATGIVRRIDDLGRVVIPKEIRRTLRIRVGDPLEIFTDREGEIILKKYSPIGELGAYAADYAESLAQTTAILCVWQDKDTMIAAAGTGRRMHRKSDQPGTGADDPGQGVSPGNGRGKAICSCSAGWTGRDCF